jgi:hypothetical protein
MTTHLRLLGAIVATVALGNVAGALVITNADLVGGAPTVTLPANYTIDTAISGSQTADGMFDGETGNPGNGRVVFRQNSGAPLSSSNYISVSGVLASPLWITDVQLAHDWGGASTQEVKAVEVLFYDDVGTPLLSFPKSGLNDGTINDIDDVVRGIAVPSVKSFDFRIADGEGSPHVLEVREVLLTGSSGPPPLPPAGLLVDFNDNDSGPQLTQDGYAAVTQAGGTVPTAIGVGGAVTVTLPSGGLPNGMDDRDRGALTGGPGLAQSDLLRDFVFTQAGQLDITLSTLAAGIYEFTGYFHDNNVDQGFADLLVDVGDGNGFDLKVDDLAYSTSSSPDPVGSGRFRFAADGTSPVVIRMDSSGGQYSGANDVINGFSVKLVPEPTTSIIWTLGLLGLAFYARRRRNK